MEFFELKNSFETRALDFKKSSFNEKWDHLSNKWNILYAKKFSIVIKFVQVVANSLLWSMIMIFVIFWVMDYFNG